MALSGTVNCFVGDDPVHWRSGIPTYAKTTYHEVYRGIDVVYYGNQGQLEYDFVVQPGSSAESIGLQFEGAEQIEIDDNGELLLHTRAGVIRNGKPHVYQSVEIRLTPRDGRASLRRPSHRRMGPSRSGSTRSGGYPVVLPSVGAPFSSVKEGACAEGRAPPWKDM